MGTALQLDNATIVTAFQAALLHQGLIVLVMLAALALAWNALRAVQLRRAFSASAGGAVPDGRATSAPDAAVGGPEPIARRVLRIGFGLAWILDGVLQGQVAMPLGMTSQVMRPAAATSPGWVQQLVNFGSTIWNDHPVTAAAASVWIQIGIGIWLLVAPRGGFSRSAGLASAGWGALVWVFGEAFGGLFAPGMSWMFGAPGAVTFYILAGVLIALPERSFASPRLGRRLIDVMGAFFLAMAVLQAWPGRGFWRGAGPHGRGTLTAMVAGMARTRQPTILARLVASFASFDAAHGWAVNLAVVAGLAATGIALLARRAPILRAGVAMAVVLCLADWVLVEDFGVFGGVGTDPNSMVPMVLVLVAGFLAITRVTAPAATPVTVLAPRNRARALRSRLSANPTYAFRALAALGAVAIVVLGAAPMALASVSRTADPIVAQAIDGTPNLTDVPAPAFRLTDQNGREVSLASLRGRTLAVTFLDPVCTSDCPIIAQEFRASDAMLGAAAGRVEYVAVVANPVYRSTGTVRAFDRAEGLDHLANWLFLTGSLPELERVWANYGIQLAVEPGGAMVAHSDLAYVIDATGHTRDVLDTNPGPGSAASRSSFAGVLTGAIRTVLGQ